MNYYSLRAKGGTGLIILENANIEYPAGSNGTSQIRIDHDSFMPRYYQLVENLHKNGATVAIQINHAGASASSARTGMETVSSSNIPTKVGGEVPRPMTKEEILTTVKKYGEAAKRVQAIGFDAIEIHCGHSYLMSQFISPYYNKRTDEFGGSVENRLRFPRMVLEEVRKNVGPWFPIIVRISAEERVPGGNTLEDTLEYLEYLDEFVDMYDVSCGLNPSLQYQIDSNFLPDGWRSYMSRAVKDKFGKPVINAGNYRDPKVVEKVLESGDVDIVGMGRGLIAEPNWVKKVENGEEDFLRKCISCNVGCAGNRIGVNRPIRCTVNPAVPEGDIYKALKVNKNCNVVVVGGGNVSMDAVSTAKRLGAKKVSIVYRRRVADMTALPAEIEGAIAEGIEVQTLKAPASLDIDENHHIKGMYVTPQMISEIKGGRASVKATGEPDQYIPCDILVVAIGQNIETDHFAEAGIPVERGKIVTTAGGDFLDMPGVFAGGDCASGPATVIKAIAAAKVVAANIDEYLGYHHEISCDVEIPKASLHDRVPCGRAELTEREACERVCDFEGVENCMTEKEAKQEACRCLRCDHFGYGIFKGGREKLW